MRAISTLLRTSRGKQSWESLGALGAILMAVSMLLLVSGCATLNAGGEGPESATGSEDANGGLETPPPPESPPMAFAMYAFLGQYILFPVDSTDYLPTGERAIEEAVDWMNRLPYATVVVVGHTDDTGPAAYNQELGQKRAERVAKELTKAGIEPSRITVVSKGESEPAVPNDTRANRALNRRVHLQMNPSRYCGSLK